MVALISISAYFLVVANPMTGDASLPVLVTAEEIISSM